MLRRRTALLVVTGWFLAALLLSLLTHSNGVVRNDPARNIWTPGELTMPLQLQVAFNETQIYFHYRWPAKEPHVLTDLLRYSDGNWQWQTRTPIGSDPDGLAEDRLSMMLDDGSVPEFQRYGGYITVGANMRDFTGSGADATHRRKYLPATRKDPGDWYSIADAATLDAQRRAGYFLDGPYQEREDGPGGQAAQPRRCRQSGSVLRNSEVTRRQWRVELTLCALAASGNVNQNRLP